MKKKIYVHLNLNRSYFKKGINYLADFYGCSPKTVKNIVNSLSNEKKEYLANLKAQNQTTAVA